MLPASLKSSCGDAALPMQLARRQSRTFTASEGSRSNSVHSLAVEYLVTVQAEAASPDCPDPVHSASCWVMCRAMPSSVGEPRWAQLIAASHKPSSTPLWRSTVSGGRVS